MTDSTKPRWDEVQEKVGKALDWIDRYWKPVVALAGPLIYMAVFQVTPWMAYSEIKDKRNHVRFHDGMGQDFLKRGSYARAREEYRQALALNPTDYEGMNGAYLADLFLELDSPSLEPAVEIGVRRHLDELGIVKRSGYREIVMKYLADLDVRIGKPERAELCYDNAIALDSDYLDALYTEGWWYYESGRKGGGDREGGADRKAKMFRLFRRMTVADSSDFRGFHGYGYSLYMRAVDGGSRDTLKLATMQSVSAANLAIKNRLNVVMDLGEIARSDTPSLALKYHNRARKILADSALAATPWNKSPLNVCLLAGQAACLSLDDGPSKRAWIDYQLSLDYEALRRTLLIRSRPSDSLWKDSLGMAEDSFRALLDSAKGQDGKGYVMFIYKDQLRILNRFLPVPEAEAPAGRPR